MSEPVRYLTDDRDLPPEEQNELEIMPGENGDWYVSVVPRGQGSLGRGVRLCTSGGASTRCPGLTVAIAEAYRAMVAGTKPPVPKIKPAPWNQPLDYRYCAGCGRHCGHRPDALQCVICDAAEARRGGSEA